MAMVVARWRREGDGGGSEGDGGGGLGSDAGGDNDGRVGEGDGGGGLGEGSVGEGEGGACDGGGCERTIPECPKPAAASTVIFGTSTTSRVDSAPARLSSGFCARASRSQMDLLCRTPPSASPAQRKKKMSCAHEAHVSTRTARSRRSARSSRSRSRRWQASGGEPGGEEGACPAALRTAAGKQQALRPVPATTAWHRATVLALASESDETSRRSSPASPAHRPARCGRAPESPAQRGEGSADPPRAARANGVAYSADIRASGLLRRLPEVLPRGLRRLWDGAPCPITLAQFPARQHLAGKIRFSGPALYYNYPLFTAVMHLLGARLCALRGQ
jgi:hypothetical protein